MLPISVPRQNPKIPNQGRLKKLFGKIKSFCWIATFRLTQSTTIFQTTYRPQTIPINQHPNHD